MKRIFSVRINLDDMAASLEFLEGDASLAEWLRGFRYGLRGAPSRWASGPGAAGFHIGSRSLSEAHEFQLAKSDGGKRSAEARKEKVGTAQPARTHLEDTSNTARTHLEDTSVKNYDSSNQSLSVNRLSTNVDRESLIADQKKEREALRPPRHPKNIIPPTKAMVESYCEERNNSIDADKFLNRYEANGWLVGKSKMKDWQAAIRTWEGNGFNGPIKPKDDHYGEEGESLPTNLSDLPDGHPLKPIKKKAQAIP